MPSFSCCLKSDSPEFLLSFLNVLQPWSESYLNAKMSSMAANLISKTSSTPVQLNVLLTKTIQHRKYHYGATLDIWCWKSFHGYSLESTRAAQNLSFKWQILAQNDKRYIYIARVSDSRSLRRIWLLLERNNYWFDDWFKTTLLLCSTPPPLPENRALLEPSPLPPVRPQWPNG